MLKLNTQHVQGDSPVTVLSLSGELDAASYESAIDKTAELYNSGTRDLLLDLSDLTFMSSTGLVALHSMALIMRGETLSDEDEGWGKFKAIARDVEMQSGSEQHFKLFNPQDRVRNTLEISGFSQILDIYDDRNQALASF